MINTRPKIRERKNDLEFLIFAFSREINSFSFFGDVGRAHDVQDGIIRELPGVSSPEEVGAHHTHTFQYNIHNSYEKYRINIKP
jgi:hypothetical protein